MDFETWEVAHRAKIEILEMSLRTVERSKDLADAVRQLKLMKDIYAAQVAPMGLKKSRGADDVSPAGIRKHANAPWDDKSGY